MSNYVVGVFKIKEYYIFVGCKMCFYVWDLLVIVGLFVKYLYNCEIGWGFVFVVFNLFGCDFGVSWLIGCEIDIGNLVVCGLRLCRLNN